MSHVKVTFNDGESVVVNAVPSPAAPGSYIDLNRTVQNAFKARDLRDPEERYEDEEEFRITIETFVLDPEDVPPSSSGPQNRPDDDVERVGGSAVVDDSDNE